MDSIEQEEYERLTKLDDYKRNKLVRDKLNTLAKEINKGFYVMVNKEEDFNLYLFTDSEHDTYNQFVTQGNQWYIEGFLKGYKYLKENKVI